MVQERWMGQQRIETPVNLFAVSTLVILTNCVARLRAWTLACSCFSKSNILLTHGSSRDGLPTSGFDVAAPGVLDRHASLVTYIEILAQLTRCSLGR